MPVDAMSPFDPRAAEASGVLVRLVVNASGQMAHAYFGALNGLRQAGHAGEAGGRQLFPELDGAQQLIAPVIDFAELHHQVFADEQVAQGNFFPFLRRLVEQFIFRVDFPQRGARFDFGDIAPEDAFRGDGIHHAFIDER